MYFQRDRHRIYEVPCIILSLILSAVSMSSSVLWLSLENDASRVELTFWGMARVQGEIQVLNDTTFEHANFQALCDKLPSNASTQSQNVCSKVGPSQILMITAVMLNIFVIFIHVGWSMCNQENRFTRIANVALPFLLAAQYLLTSMVWSFWFGFFMKEPEMNVAFCSGIYLSVLTSALFLVAIVFRTGILSDEKMSIGRELVLQRDCNNNNSRS